MTMPPEGWDPDKLQRKPGGWDQDEVEEELIQAHLRAGARSGSGCLLALVPFQALNMIKWGPGEGEPYWDRWHFQSRTQDQGNGDRRAGERGRLGPDKETDLDEISDNGKLGSGCLTALIMFWR